MTRAATVFLRATLLVLATVAPAVAASAQDEAWVDSFTVDDLPVTGALAPSQLRHARAANPLERIWGFGRVVWGALLGSRKPHAMIGPDAAFEHERLRRRGFSLRSRSTSVLPAGKSLVNVDLRCAGGARSWHPDVDITVWIGISLDGQLIASNQSTGYQPSTVTNQIVSTVSYDRPIECGVYAAGAQAIAKGTFFADCGNPIPTLIRREYKDYSVNMMPECSQIEEWPGDRFTKSEDTHGTWGILRSVIFVRLAAIQEYAALGDMDITSGYRCPHRNALIPGAAANSRHMYGDALDMYPPAQYYTPKNEYYFDWIRNAAAQTSPYLLTEWETYADRHLHADWRNQ